MHAFSIYALSALSIAFVNAAPLNKRDVVWVTETDVAVVTVPVTKTVWTNAPTTAAFVNHHRWSRTTVVSSSVSTASPSAYSTSAVETTTSAASETSSSSSVFVAPTTESTTSVSVAPTTSTSVYVAPTTSTSVYVAPTTSTSVYVAPTTSTSVYVAPTTSSSSVYVAPTTSSSSSAAPTYAPTTSYVAPTTSTTAPAATSTASSGSGGTTAGSSYTGDFTWYDDGLGACGVTSVASDHIVAISEIVFDQYTPNGNPNNNPLCGRTINLVGVDGTTYPATVVDRCTGCAAGDLDLSEDFFNLVTSNGNGRVSNMKWSWD